jgi:signal transduction histidine kinase
MDVTRSGLPLIGDLRWGTHFCQFYETADDLAEALVPFFKAGLESNEQCMWVTSEPFRADDAMSALRSAVPDLDGRSAKGQIEIVNYEDWYVRQGRQNPDEVIASWLSRKEQALSRGYAGLRITGNTFWLERHDWAEFAEYEEKVNTCFGDQRIIALCSYCLDRCGGREILDVVRNHQFAVVRRAGEWELIESAALKLAKEELRRANEALEQRVIERTAELRAALAARDQFLSVASHELKTPVTALMLYLDSIVQGIEEGRLSDEERHRRLYKALESCQRLATLIERLLDISHHAAGLPHIERHETDLAALARQVAERLDETARQAGCRLSVRAEGPVSGSWDEMRLDQVLTNLISNAIVYAPGGPIDVEVAAAANRAVLTVADAGPGVAPADRARIFDRFVQLDPERRQQGFGLGLWIVRQNVEAHGGSVSLVSKPGAGAVFRVELPTG